MKKIYAFLFAVVMIATCASSAKATTTSYNGKLTISFMGMPIESEATVSIITTSDSTCTFSLPNFSFKGTSVGDIVVENVSTTEKADSIKYNGSKEGLELAEGAIGADVTINGYTTAAGAADFSINVKWNKQNGEPMDAEILIPVTFVAPEGSATVGVENIAADNAAAVYGTRGAINVTGYEGRVDVYSIAGQLVNSQIIGSNSQIAMPQGVYIVKIANNATKVIVK